MSIFVLSSSLGLHPLLVKVSKVVLHDLVSFDLVSCMQHLFVLKYTEFCLPSFPLFKIGKKLTIVLI